MNISKSLDELVAKLESAKEQADSADGNMEMSQTKGYIEAVKRGCSHR